MQDIGIIWLEHVHWGLTTAVYLFFAALGGGAYLAGLTAYGLDEGGDRTTMEFARWAFLVALVAVAVAGVAILSHLADPLAGVLFPVTLTNFESWITRGTWILVSLGLVSALHVLWFHFGSLGTTGVGASGFVRSLAGVLRLRDPLDRLANVTLPAGGRYWVVAVLGVLPAVGTVYTGFELAAVESVPLWNNPTMLPGVFLASGIAAGVAAALALTVAFEGTDSRLVAVFGGVVTVAALATAVLLWGFWSSVGGSPAGTSSTTMLTAGPLQTAFTVVVVGIGVSLVAVPVLAWAGYARGDSRLSRLVVRPGLVASLSLVVVASFLLRYAVLLAAVKEPLVVVGA